METKSRHILGQWVTATTLVLASFIFPARAKAAGGSCPSGANYLNAVTNTLTTLSALDITNCYYVAANGSDLNNGTSESTPLLHAPGMQQCSDICASIPFSAGMGVIFRGGDIWHFGNSSATPYAGVVMGCSANNTVPAGLCLDSISGTSTNPIYYGIDLNWYNGPSWTRPIFTADNPLCGSSTVNGTSCSSWTDKYGQTGYYVSSCSYQIGSSNNLVDIGSSQYVILDDFELSGLCQNHVTTGTAPNAAEPDGDDVYLRYGGAQAPLTFERLYVHGSSHVQYAGYVSSPQCSVPGVVCQNLRVFSGAVITGSVGETVTENVLDFSDSDWQNITCFGGFYDVSYNVFRYTTDCLPNPLHVFHDNLYEYFFEDGHSNVLEDIGEGTGSNAIYNNLFRHIEASVTSGGGVFLWPAPPASTTTYIFNNLAYDVGNLEYFNFGGTAGNNALGNYTVFSNTFQTNDTQPIIRCEAYTNGAVTDTNNHYIDNQSYILGPCSTLTTTTPLLMSNATATSDGYTSSETYAYSPTSSGSPTVGAGTNEANGYCAEMLASSDPLIQAAGTACKFDTTYSSIYNASNHTVSFPARISVLRTSKWDIGTYQFLNGTSPQPLTGMGATVARNETGTSSRSTPLSRVSHALSAGFRQAKLLTKRVLTGDKATAVRTQSNARTRQVLTYEGFM